MVKNNISADGDDRFATDVKWSRYDELREKGIRLFKDNSVERGQLKSISPNQYLNPRYKWDDVPSFHDNMQYSLHYQDLPCSSDEFGIDILKNVRQKIKHKTSCELLLLNEWIDKDHNIYPIDYHINKQGFRHDGTQEDILSETGGVIYLGDSTTFGTSTCLEENFTYLAHHSCPATKDLRYINMGCHGHGIDAYYRLLKFYLDKVQPDYVVISYPWFGTRTEIWNMHDNIWESQTVNKVGRRITESKEQGLEKIIGSYFHSAASYLRWYKSVDAIKYLCLSRGVGLYIVEEHTEDEWIGEQSIGYSHQIKPKDWGRDLTHSGRLTHKHNGVIMAKIMERLWA